MDANGQRFWMLCEAQHFELPGEPPALVYDSTQRCLQLASQRRNVSFVSSETIARQHLDIVPQTLDGFGNRAFWDAESGRVLAIGHATGPGAELELLRIPEDATDVERQRLTPTDLAMGHDGILYIARGGRILMQDRRDRWNDADVGLEGLAAWRLAAHDSEGVWILDRTHRRLGLLQGTPLPRSAEALLESTTAACEANPTPPRLHPIDVAFPADEEPVALAASTGGLVAVLVWTADGSARVRLLSTRHGRPVSLGDPIGLTGAQRPFCLDFVSEDRIAVLIAGVRGEAVVYAIEGRGPQLPVGDLYPLKRSYDGGPFVHTLERPCRTVATDSPSGTKALHALSFPLYARHGEASNDPTFAPLDGNDPGMVWHRLFVEAVVPEDTSIRIWLAATARPVPPSVIAPEDWFEHRVGGTASGRSDVPVAVWERMPSEVAHHPGLLPCPTEADTAGLFSVLIQRSGRAMRSLGGRYLHVHIELTGNGRVTPQLYALRAYGKRFSYVDQYLPHFYRQSLTGPDADAISDATPEDFLERFVANFEGVLTSIEDRIGHGYLLTDPKTVPASSLAWLGSWIGMDFDGAVETARRREQLAAAAHLRRWRGTLLGMKLALQIATGGAVSSGEVVVLEDFRLRRTFTTILGADLDDETDPLTTGATVSGNSYVGDTLFLGDETRKEFLALFSADLDLSVEEQVAVRQLYDELAFRVTILVHESVEPQDLGLIEAVVAREAPAHVGYRIVSASRALLVGMASLVGVDTYLTFPPVAQPARIDRTRLGAGDYVLGPAALDRRLDAVGAGGPTDRPPFAVASDVAHLLGETVRLDAGASRAFDGRVVETYTWTLEEG